MYKSTINAGDVLEQYGFRRTSTRIDILGALAKEQTPLRIESLQKALPMADSVTLYRALDALTEAGVLERSDFQHGHAHYELAYGRPHHHHIVCENCGKIEEIAAPKTEHLNKEALKKSTHFRSITRHSLEFYGVCKTCSK